MDETFGQYLRSLRSSSRRMTQEELAQRIGRVKMTVSLYERDGAPPPQGEALDKIVEALALTDEEEARLRFLASAKRGSVPADVVEYFFDHPIVYDAIRAAQRRGAETGHWEYFIQTIGGSDG